MTPSSCPGARFTQERTASSAYCSTRPFEVIPESLPAPLPPVALVARLGCAKVLERRPAILLQRQLGLRGESDRSQREGQRMRRERPPGKWARVVQLCQLVLVADVEDRQATVRLPDEVVVKGDGPARAVLDVGVQTVIGLAG